MQHKSIRVVRPGQFDSAPAQTPGSQRLAAVYPAAGFESPMWGCLFAVEYVFRVSEALIKFPQSTSESRSIHQFFDESGTGKWRRLGPVHPNRWRRSFVVSARKISHGPRHVDHMARSQE
jgi:hypothetical protein